MSHAKRKRSSDQKAGNERRFTVRGVRRDPVDMSKLSKALLGLAMAETERQAELEHTQHAANTVEADEPGIASDTPAAGPQSGGEPDA